MVAPTRDAGASVTPEQFGAAGDGVTDDSAALQRAFDAVAARGVPGVVVLQPRIAYRCDRGLVLDCSLVSLWGQGLLEFVRCPDVCLHINASSVARGFTPAQNYGHRGMISGALRVRGGGVGKTATGIRFDTQAAATAAQMLVENMSVSGCTTGIVFGRRAYNNVLVRCDIFECGTCVHWPEADDNGERNTLVGCTLFNSEVAVRVAHPSAALYLESCSIDYTRGVYDAAPGMVFATDCHHESSRWSGRPFRCAGDGAAIHLTGGVILGQADPLAADFLFETGAGASARLNRVFLHNIVLGSATDGIPTLATGSGAFQVAMCECFEFSRLPVRLHDARTTLADPDFAAPDWQDAAWRLTDGGRPVTSRHGTAADTLVAQRTAVAGQPALSLVKRSEPGMAAAFALLCLPVRPGEQVAAGFQVRRDPRYPGGGAALRVAPSWARIDGHDPNRVPVVTRLETPGAIDATPITDRYSVVRPIGPRAARTAPGWATHFVMVVDLTRYGPAGLLFRGLWCDTL